MPKTHGMTGTPTYHSWCKMRARCLDRNNNRFESHGARGIKFCKRWERFELFLEDMGIKPRGTSLDRKNNDGHYHKRNCRWATPAQQARNTRKTVFIAWKGRKRKLADVADSLGLTPKAAWQRLRKGIPLDAQRRFGGVTKHKTGIKRFQARVTVNGQRRSLGYFKTHKEAVKAIRNDDV